MKNFGTKKKHENCPRIWGDPYPKYLFKAFVIVLRIFKEFLISKMYINISRCFHNLDTISLVFHCIFRNMLRFILHSFECFSPIL